MAKLDSRRRLSWLKRQDDLPPRSAGSVLAAAPAQPLTGAAQ